MTEQPFADPDGTEEPQPATSAVEFNIYLVAACLLLIYAGWLSVKNHQLRSRLDKIQPQLEKLERLDESKNQLFSIVAHDLRSAVYTLQINVSGIKNLLKEGGQDQALLLASDTEHVITSTQSLLNNLLYWALSQTGQISHQPEKVDFQPILDQVCYDYYPIAAAKKLVLFVKVTPGLQCTIDVNSMKIVLRNLIDNAIKYTETGGIIIVSAWEAMERCHISVQDTGIGMDASLLRNISGNDRRRIQEDTHGRRSTGIGLWLVGTMTEKNEGSFEVSSVPGIGTTVKLSVPIGTATDPNSEEA